MSAIKTAVWPASEEFVDKAAEVLKSGRLVAFPTETVYGLGADALNEAAVASIFHAKGRPATNPVIVHVDRDYSGLVIDPPPVAEILAKHFWPGPLTFVMKRSTKVPDIVTAGGPTVAIRSPAHPVARRLIETCGPIAAPSANRSMCLSPTRAEHVLRSLDGRIEVILDGGPCADGLESTVIDLTTDPPTLLRPGPISVARLEAIVGPVKRIAEKRDIARSPGQLAKHYSPATPIEFAYDGAPRVLHLSQQGLRVGWLMLDVESTPSDIFLAMPPNPQRYAACLYDMLHRLDAADLDRIVVTLPPEDDAWLAIHDRLSRMAGPV